MKDIGLVLAKVMFQKDHEHRREGNKPERLVEMKIEAKG